MKKTLYVLMALCMLFGAYSCSDENIGSSITDSMSHVIMDSSFTMTGASVRNSSLQARSSAQLLGIINSPGYGTLASDVVSEFMPAANIDTSGTKLDWIDSCRLVMRIAADGFTGDSLVPMRLNVYRLNRQLPSPIYSDFNPDGYYSKSDLLGSTSYSANSLQLPADSAYANTYREVYVPMPVSLAKDIFNLYVTDKSVFNTPSKFARHFPGIYIANSYGKGRVMNFYDTELEVFYRKHQLRADTTDTIVTATQSYLGVTPEVQINNNVSLTIDQSVKSMVDAGEAIVMGPAGYEVRVKFPIQEIIDSYRKNVGTDLAVINSLSLSLPVEQVKNKYDIAPPSYLLMVKEGHKQEFFDGDSLTNSKDSFYASYNASTKSYEFTGMRDYVLNIINNKGGHATDDDVNLVITPVDVTTYTQSSSYYYGYGTSSGKTVVTKIAPAISYPSIAKLLLNKAKIKITYSKQSL